MTATIGPDDFDFTASPRPDLLRAVTGLQPGPAQTHVLLADYGVNSCQRLAAGDAGGRVTFGLWPAELKEQANHLYGQRRGRRMISAARAHDWSAAPSPHLAFWNAAPIVRLYMSPPLDAAEYVGRWEDGDLDLVGAYAPAEVRATLWPWLKGRGYATAEDDITLETWLTTRLKNRPAFMRPGLRLKRHCGRADFLNARAASSTVGRIREELSEILEAAGDVAPWTR
jgi:hypothetical protein